MERQLRPTQRREMPSEGPLPPHRIAFRALVCAPIGGLVAVLAMTALFYLLSNERAGNDTPLIVASLAASLAVWCGLLVFAVEVSCHLKSSLRYAAPLAIGPFLVLAIIAASAWIVALSEGRGMQWVTAQLLSVLGDFTRNPASWVWTTLAFLLPFGTLSSLQLAVLAGRRTPSRLLEVGAVAATGLVGFCFLYAAHELPPSELGVMAAPCVATPAAAALGMQGGARLERVLLRWWASRRDD